MALSLTEKFTRFAKRQYHWHLTAVKYNFMSALSGGDFDKVKWTVDLFPEAVNWQGGHSLNGTWEGSRPLQTAFFARNCGGGNVRMMAFLLDSGAHVNGQDEAGNTALHRAAWYGDKDAVTLLIARGADPSQPNKNGVTAYWAADEGSRQHFPGANPREFSSYMKTQADIYAAAHAAATIQSCTEGTQEAVPVRNRPLKLKKSKITY